LKPAKTKVYKKSRKERHNFLMHLTMHAKWSMPHNLTSNIKILKTEKVMIMLLGMIVIFTISFSRILIYK